MQYAILCYHDEKVTCAWSKEEDDAVMAKLSMSDSAKVLKYLGGDRFANDEMNLIFGGQNGKIRTLKPRPPQSPES